MIPGDTPARRDDRALRLGIIGGVGPSASARFYVDLVEECTRRAAGRYPELVLHSLGLSGALERAFVTGNFDRSHEARARELLEDSVRLLRGCDVDGIVLLCNTLHSYLWQVVDDDGRQCLDLVRATCEHVWWQGARRVLLLATAATVASGIYPRRAAPLGVEIEVPTPEDQQVVNRVISSALEGLDGSDARERALSEVVRRAAGSRTEAVVLGCTDLGVLRLDTGGLPVVDSLSCLVQASAGFLTASPARTPAAAAAEYTQAAG